jgi:hypothetical protein
MKTLVTVIVIAAIATACVGAVISLVPLLSLTREGQPLPRRPLTMSAGLVYWNYAGWTAGLGVFLVSAPHNWYGPSWGYFAPMVPHNGFGMGVCCVGLGSLLMLALWRDLSARILSILLFLNGFVYWMSGIILGAEGLLGHQGLMESPFMMILGAIAFALSAAIRTGPK